MQYSLDAVSLRQALQGLKQIYPGDTTIYFSIEKCRILLESIDTGAKFSLGFDLEEKAESKLLMRKTDLQTMSTLLGLLVEYPDLSIKGVKLEETEEGRIYLEVEKELLKDENSEEILKLRKKVNVTAISDVEREAVLKVREGYTGEVQMMCPAELGEAARKAKVVEAESLGVRGRYANFNGGGGLYRMYIEGLAEDVKININTKFMCDIMKLGAEDYSFYDKHVCCDVGEIRYSIGIPPRDTSFKTAESMLSLFDEIDPKLTVYYKELLAYHGKGPLRINYDGKGKLNEKIDVGAPFISGGSEAPFEVGNGQQLSVSIDVNLGEVLGDIYTVGVGLKNNKGVALLKGECDALIHAY